MFRAYEPERDRLVAVKVFRLDLPPERAHQLVGEFERLIEAGLRHLAISTPVATGLTGVVPYLAQDFFSGDSLDIVMREKGPIPAVEVLRIARQLAEGLDFAAERSVEHGALNPRDILLSPEGACIVGIGVTRALEHIGAATPIRRPYTSPERLSGADWDRRADVFSLAAVVYEMLWGRRLVGTGMHAVESMTPLPGTHLAPLQAVFAGALAEQAVDRYPTALEFVESLERAASSEVATPETIEAFRNELSESRPGRGLRTDEPRHVGPVEPLLPLDDEVRPVEEDLSELSLSAPEPEPKIQTRGESGPWFPSEERAGPPKPLELRQPLAPLGHLKLEEPLEPLEPLKAAPPREPAPPFLTSAPPFSTPSAGSSSVGPLGFACIVGLAIGFGLGYMLGTRDRPSVARSAGEPLTATSAPVSPPPPAQPSAVTREVLPSDTPAPVAPFSGRLVVHSMPAGARVFVDGRDRGAAPATIAGLAQGEHRVRIVRDGYTTVEQRVVLSPSQPSELLSVPLVKTPVAPNPGSSPPAKADLVAPKPGSNQPAKADAETQLGGKPSSDSGVLVLDSRPMGATAFLDGRAVGRTPVMLPDVKAGDHSVRFELDQHRTWTASIKVVGGTANRVGGSLEKID